MLGLQLAVLKRSNSTRPITATCCRLAGQQVVL